MRRNGFAEAFYKNAGYLIVALVSVIYVSSSLINIEKTGKSAYEIIASGILSLIVGAMINGVFRSIGIKRGDEDDRTVATCALHARAVDEISYAIDRLDEFCQGENKRAKREVRTRILAKEGLKHDDYFNNDGDAIGTAPTDRKKKRAYNKALRVKMKSLVSSNLTSEGARANDPFDFGKSKKEFASQRNASDILVKLLMAIIFGYFGVSLSGEINVAGLIWNTLQITMYIGCGIIQMYSSYMWIVEDYRGSIIKKIDYLQKFRNTLLTQKE